jgi:hypothetical protein
MPRLPMAARALLGALSALLLRSPAADALLLADFEQPYFLETMGIQCKDHTVVKHDGLYHVFYIQSLPPDGHYLRKEQWFGHITSPDLRHWTRRDSVLSVDIPNPPAWESEFVWAPKIIKDPSSNDWLMYYTGATEDLTQQTGLASTYDLYHWYRWAGSPLYHPGSWAVWSPGEWSNCRDPELFREEGSSQWYLLNTVTMAPDSLGAISYALSTNLGPWTDQGAFFVNDSQNVLESVQLVKRDGDYHLFFTEGGEQLISHIASPTFTGGWSKANRTYVDEGHACEITSIPGEPELWSLHRGVELRDGARFFFRFGDISFDEPGGEPAISFHDGFADNWTVVFGTAFSYQPTWGDNPYERSGVPTGMEGNSYVATYEFFPNPDIVPPGRIQGNVPTGLMRSDDFTVSGDRLKLLVGGGNKPGLAFVALVRASDERILCWETGTNSHGLTPRLWDLSSLAGQTVFVVIADLSTETWGHIAVDSIEEYFRVGQDPQPPTLPLTEGPLLGQVLSDAGFGWSAAPALPVAGSGRLLAPHPNPFNPSTRLRYELQAGGHVGLEILDAQGRALRTLLDEELSAGPGFVVWDGRDGQGARVASGVYFARLRLDGRDLGRQKLLLLK